MTLFPRGFWTPQRIERLAEAGIAIALAAAVYVYVVFFILIFGPV